MAATNPLSTSGPATTGSNNPLAVPPGPPRRVSGGGTMTGAEIITEIGADGVTNTEIASVSNTIKGDIGAGLDDLTPAEVRTLIDLSYYETFAKKATWNASGNTAVPGIDGWNTLTSVGTVRANNPAATSLFTRATRTGFESAAGAGSLASLRLPTVGMSVSDGAGTGIGGFWLEIVFGLDDPVLVTDARSFFGAWVSAGAHTNVEPNTLLNCIGIGHGAADTTLSIYYGGSVAQTPIALGANFPCNTASVDLYRVIFHAPEDTANSITYYVTRLNTGHTATGTVAGNSVVLPQSGTMICPFNSFRCNNATAAAARFVINYIKLGRPV
jgi:hypothetical protein